MISFYFWLTK